MKKTVYIRFTIILLIVGFMLAVQYNTVQNPETRDTRDIWAIRQELSKETETHSELLSEVYMLDQTILKYGNMVSESAAFALEDTVVQLKEDIGLVDYTGPGLTIKVEPSLESIALGQPVEGISPDLLIRLINEINRFKAKDIEVDGKRIIYSSPIRDVNGKTTVNNIPVRNAPFMIRIGTSTYDEAQKMYNQLEASTIGDDFYIDNLKLKIGEPEQIIRISAYDQPVNNHFLKEVPEGES
ncbi:DUF881 domain-containing protein [Psychrobacillus psychrodurans]|jgi:uncharacterized protein YlxW (UPF0749 family)|uniref:DUF881 domain-containing protein n=1 Tax=Psychrobacillus TaxID=1221880 RepID=UPI0008DF7116|nr:DUF881 domain-containing protein [Psychrobacillus psychrodurans]MCK1996250.1 DUF881 domain-containing protein [Psychrobacillus psychrodurans]MCZ8539448.1 DUF881 domain-containing protein [Psychrobacillus psychrodurans]SFM39117.1 Uncharacterized conserved protein YlxW, UPF0749 family [Psychrobacillus psychrodurans]